MIKNIIYSLIVIVTVFAISSTLFKKTTSKISGAPPFGVAEDEVPDINPFTMYKNWVRPEGPAKVALQVGHWKRDEVPEELTNLKNNTGAAAAGITEVEVNMDITLKIKDNLERIGVEVEILPVTIPPKYWADVFLAVHADGSEDLGKSGFKFAGPWRDLTGKSAKVVEILENHYEEATGMQKDSNITRNMRGYYAFSWWRYEHAIHPMTVGIIAETGFLTNRKDRDIIVDNSEISANAISNALVEYLKAENLL